MNRLGVVSFENKILKGDYENFWSFIMDAEVPSERQEPAQKENHKYWMESTRGNWYGLNEEKDFKGVKKMVMDGWPEGLLAMEKALGTLSIDVPPVSVRRKRVRSDFGDELDVHRLYSGDFEHAFTSMKRPPGTKRRIFKIVVDSIASGGRDADEMFWQGAAAIKLGELLSLAGYTVELYSAFKANASGTDIDLRVKVKSSDAPLDLCSAAATLALPAFFRCIGHTWIHANLETKHRSEGVSVESLSDEDGDFVAGQDLENPRSAARWIEESIRSLYKNPADLEIQPCDEDDEEGEDDDEEDGYYDEEGDDDD